MLQGTERVPSLVWAGGKWGDIKHLEEVRCPVILLLAFPLGPSKAPGGGGLQTVSLVPVPWVEKRCWEMSIMTVAAAAKVTA